MVPINHTSDHNSDVIIGDEVSFRLGTNAADGSWEDCDVDRVKESGRRGKRSFTWP